MSFLFYLHLAGVVYACLLGGRSKWRCFQEAPSQSSRLLVDFRRWNDHAGWFAHTAYKYNIRQVIVIDLSQVYLFFSYESALS